MKIDLHVHTFFSDGDLSPADVVKVARKLGLNGIAICDHNTCKGHLTLAGKAYKDFVVIPGIEVSTSKGHLVGLGVKQTFRRDLEPIETSEEITAAGGLVVLPHPGKVPSGIPIYAITEFKFEAVEVINGRSSASINAGALALAKQRKKAQVGGSDGHRARQIGTAYTTFSSEYLKLDDILEDIRKRRTKAEGKGTTAMRNIQDNVRIFSRFAGRGFKKV